MCRCGLLTGVVRGRGVSISAKLVHNKVRKSVFVEARQVAELNALRGIGVVSGGVL